VSDFLSFHLSDEFVQQYSQITPPWGFGMGGGNTLGELTFIGKYSRRKPDGTKERWHEVCRRCIEGMYSILKDHCVSYRTPWNERKARLSAEDAFERMFMFKWLPPGRGLWMMGTPFVNGQHNSAALQNCAFLSTEKISSRSVQDAVLPFVRLMEMSMLGVGVGFDTKGAGKIALNEPDSEREEVFVIEDSREGWYESLGVLLESYFFGNRPTVKFDYLKIRAAGEPILGFGGVAAGPGPLMALHEKISSILGGRDGERISTTDIVDICNLIGKCVVAGNVRRSALLSLGDPDDEDFLALKNREINPERMGADGWGWTSNNSVEAKVGTDYSQLADAVVLNGEPGLVYTDLCRQYGRLIDEATNRDYRVAGCNPCAEQSLENNELCTLVETFPINCDDLDDWVRTLKYAYLYGKAVTLLSTHWPESNEVMQRNRRIGCSVTGQAEFVERFGVMVLKEWLNAGYQAISSRDVQYSEWLGVRESIKKTSVKPSGTVSLVAGVTPGVHWPASRGKYLRRVRYRVGDPAVAVLEAAGYEIEADVMDPSHSQVVTFPVQGPEIRSEREVSVWEKMYLAVHHQRYWADNMVSLTATFRPDERDQVPAVLRAFEGQLKVISMLPLSEQGEVGFYAQMPYEQVSADEWQERFDRVRPLRWDRLYSTDALDASGERFCTSDHCELTLPAPAEIILTDGSTSTSHDPALQ
jgi:ribonucleoside-triphosphate reductase (thioredoxin)